MQNGVTHSARKATRIGIPGGPADRVAAMILLLVSCISLTNRPAAAASDPALICDRAATYAAAETGVPISVLKAISLTETGRDQGGQTRPWPWTVNMEGKGFWFETEDDALAYAEEHFNRGSVSFDVGCFQINYKWHHEHFPSIAAMFDPTGNALYAARFLLELFAEKGDWGMAAGAYHSRTPEYAERYQKRFLSYRARFLAEDTQPLRVVEIDPNLGAGSAARAVRPRVNTYPLLQPGGAAALGSLVPLGGRKGTVGLFTRDGSG